MPSAQTITSFYNFSPYTKARAIQVNSNFDNLRGHILPINPDEAHASDQEHDFGSSDHRWRTGYVQGISLSISIGASQILSGTTAGGFKIVLDNTTSMSIIGEEFTGVNITPQGMTSVAARGQFAASAPINLQVTATTLFVAGSTCTLTTIGRPVLVGLMNVGEAHCEEGCHFKTPIKQSRSILFMSTALCICRMVYALMV